MTRQMLLPKTPSRGSECSEWYPTRRIPTDLVEGFARRWRGLAMRLVIMSNDLN